MVLVTASQKYRHERAQVAHDLEGGSKTGLASSAQAKNRKCI